MNLRSKVSYSPHILTSDLGDEVVMLNIENSHYYGAESVGRLIWQHLEKPIQVIDIVDKLLETFAVERETCIQEVCEFLDALQQEGLIQLDTQSE